MLRWAIESYDGRNFGYVTIDELTNIYNSLSEDEIGNAFSYSNLSEFLQKNFVFAISSLKDGVDTDTVQTSATAFPIIPALSLKANRNTLVDFSDYLKVNEDYENKLNAYFRQMAVDTSYHTASDPLADSPTTNTQPVQSLSESIATLIFKDYFLMLTKAAIQSALDLLQYFPYTVKSGDSLTSITNLFPKLNVSYKTKAGDTVNSIASVFHITVNSLIQANPNIDFANSLSANTQLTIPLSVDIEELAIANQSVKLSEGKQINISDVVYQVRFGDKLSDIASRFTRSLLTSDKSANESLVRQYLLDIVTKLATDESLLVPNALIQTSKGSYLVVAQDSFQKIASQLNISLEELAQSSANTPNLLLPLSIIELPPFNYRISTDETLSSLANTCNFTLPELVAKIDEQSDIFPLGQILKVPQPPQVSINELWDKLVLQGSCNNIAAMVSRFLLHGLRLPDPTDFQNLSMEQIQDGLDNINWLALYEATGQQIDAPDASKDYVISVANSANVSWLKFFAYYTLDKQETLSSLISKLNITDTELKALNPTIDFSKPIAINTELKIKTTELTITLSKELLSKHSLDSTTLQNLFANQGQPVVVKSLPLLQKLPTQYNLGKKVSWHSAEIIAYAGTSAIEQLADQPDIWLFPENLTNKLTAGEISNYQLLTAKQITPNKAEITPVNCYNWAMTAKIYLQQITSQDTNQVLPNCYLILGVEDQFREVLNQLNKYLNTNNDTADLFLLYSVNTNETGQGLISDSINRNETFLLKTNLSDSQTTDTIDFNKQAANISDSKDFIQLLWEAGNAPTGGFYLNYSQNSLEDKSQNSALLSTKDGVFWLVAILKSQSGDFAPNRLLYPFNNCVVVKDNINSETSVFIQSADEKDITFAPTVPPGNIGFVLNRSNPDYETVSLRQKLRSLYNLLGYKILSNDHFFGSNEALPLSPMEYEPSENTGLLLPDYANTDPKVWQYHQVIPVYKFASKPVASNQQQNSDLPARENNPYLGIAQDAQVGLGFSFHDVYGNQLPIPLLDNPPIDVAYFDNVIGLAQWPGVASFYQFSKPAIKPLLTLQISLQIDKYIPTASQDYENAIYSSSSHLERYKQVYYQAQMDDLKFYLRTSLSQNSLEETAKRYSVDKTILQNFISANYTFLSITKNLQAYKYKVESPNTESFRKIAAKYFVPTNALFEANKQLEGLFVTPLTIPIFYLVKSGDTLKNISQVTSANAETLLNNNTPATLNTGKLINTSSRIYQFKAEDSFATIANNQLCSYLGIANANKAKPNILSPGTKLSIKNIVVEINASDTFNSILDKFKQQLPIITLQDLVTTNLNVTNIFKSGVSLEITDYIVQSGDTISSLTKAINLPSNQLANLNLDLPDLFASGTSLYLNSESYLSDGKESLVDIATKFGVTQEQLFNYNADNILQTDVYLQIPYRVTLGDSSIVSSRLAKVSDNGSLLEQATKYNVSLVDLTLANSSLDQLLQPNIPITINNISLTIDANDTFQTLVFRFLQEKNISTSISEIAISNQTTKNLLRSSATLILPPNPINISQEIDVNYPATVFPVSVELETLRDETLVVSKFRNVTNIKQQVTTIAPKTSNEQDELLSLRGFAQKLETAFSNIKLLIGKNNNNANQPVNARLWAINFSQAGVSSFQLQNLSPQYFALKPLANHCVSRSEILVKLYESGIGLNTSQKQNFQNIDLDSWMRDFLAAIDLLLSPEYAVAIYQLQTDHEFYQQLIQTKYLLANAIKNGVDYLLEVTEQDQNYRLASQQALKEQLLISLSNAYIVDSVVSFPVKVTSSFTSDSRVARFSGKPIANLYKTSSSETLSTLASYYQVSKEYLVKTLANTKGLFNKGITINYNSKSYLVADESITFQNIADNFAISLAQLADGLDIGKDKALFVANKTINVTVISKNISSTDSLSSLAEYFNTEVDELAIANQERKNLFQVNSLTFSNKIVVIEKTDTLLTISQKLSTNVATLANSLASQTGIFSSTKLYSLQILPDYFLSSSEVSLNNGENVATFLFNTNSDTKYKKLFLDLTYVINELEYNFNNDQYSNNKFSLIVPIGMDSKQNENINTYIGQTEIPIPLRAYPPPPILLRQSGDASNPQAILIEEIKLWDYNFTFETSFADQDTSYIELRFNAPNSNTQIELIDPSSDIFTALAQFAINYPKVKQDLALLLAPQISSLDTKTLVIKAVKTFIDLATNIASVCPNAYLGQVSSANSLSDQAYLYRIDNNYEESQQYLSELNLRFIKSPTSSPVWPTISLETPSGLSKLKVVAQDNQQSIYQYPENIPINASLRLKLGFIQKDITLIQNAQSAIYTTRNESLISVKPTAKAFVYQTPKFYFPNNLIPLIQNLNPISISYTSDIPSSLQNLLAKLFTNTSPNNDYVIQLSCQYAYTLVTPSGAVTKDITKILNDSLVTLLPVRLCPRFSYRLSDQDNKTSVVNDFSAKILDWAKRNSISTSKAFYIFRLELYSSLENEQVQPVLILSNLCYLN